ncbi:174_t:CDS:2 [Ambispora leptoticha]|uniref:174_t:CDS:1 n=1 Tax=Ambispora leptoticha TaxID=144679 RepID=A0A9N9D2Z3_9GLOM|nr:174_t:CDS:2 [Ambispora leptoticha]
MPRIASSNTFRTLTPTYDERSITTNYSYHASTTISPSITPPIKKSKQPPTTSTAIVTVTTPSNAADGETAGKQTVEASPESPMEKVQPQQAASHQWIGILCLPTRSSDQ